VSSERSKVAELRKALDIGIAQLDAGQSTRSTPREMRDGIRAELGAGSKALASHAPKQRRTTSRKSWRTRSSDGTWRRRSTTKPRPWWPTRRSSAADAPRTAAAAAATPAASRPRTDANGRVTIRFAPGTYELLPFADGELRSAATPRVVEID
jgi:hypothetical protein